MKKSTAIIVALSVATVGIGICLGFISKQRTITCFDETEDAELYEIPIEDEWPDEENQTDILL